MTDQVNVRIEQADRPIRTRPITGEPNNVGDRIAVAKYVPGEILTDLREFRRAMDERFDRLQEQLVQQTRWSLGFIAAFGTVFAILLGIVQLRP